MVLFWHLPAPANEAGILQPLVERIHGVGWAGVDLFFVLSGFLVGGLLIKEQKERGAIDAKRFLIRRALKIWPGYFFFLFVVIGVKAWLAPDISFFESCWIFLPNFLHLQNYLGSQRAHTWSLAVEEHFYLLLPLFLIVAHRCRRARWGVPGAMIVLAVGCLVLRWLTWEIAPPFRWTMHAYPTHLRMDSLFAGVALAWFRQTHPARWEGIARHRVWLVLGAIVLVAPLSWMSVQSKWVVCVGFSQAWFAGALMVLGLSTSSAGTGRLGRLVAWMGTASYAIYLWHVDAGVVVIRKVAALWPAGNMPDELRWLALAAIMVGTSVLVGWLAMKAIEEPVLRWRERRYPRKNSSLSMTQPDSVGK